MYGDYAYGKVMHRKFFVKQRAFSELTDQVQEAVSGIRVIKAFVQERKELAAFAKVNRLNQEKNLDVARTQALFLPLLDFVIGVSGLLTLLYGGYLTITGEIVAFRVIEPQKQISQGGLPAAGAAQNRQCLAGLCDRG